MPLHCTSSTLLVNDCGDRVGTAKIDDLASIFLVYGAPSDIVGSMTGANELNTQQKKAVETTKGPLLILAGAGAGKTKTLTERIVHIVNEGVSPKEILAITFTNKAASEMRDRVFNRLADEKTLNNPVSITERPFISTFHALGVHILKENATLLGLPRHFGIFDKDDSKKAVRDALRDLDLDPKQYEPGKILSAISREKGNGVSYEEFALRAQNDFWSGLISQVWRKYEEALKYEKALDFDDLLLRTMKILEDKKVREHYQNIWKYIHIDEYQDTNGVQYHIAKLLSEKNRNICVVGDIDQNIYSWRGARLRNILDFEKDYPEATVVTLEENYRSTQTILHVANHIIQKNKFRKEKNLFTKNVSGEPLSLFEGFDEVSEAEFVATQCEKLILSGVSPEQIAVLYRANFQSRALEEAFLAYGVKYQLLGTKFFERKEVKDVLSYIRAALEPKSLTDLKRILNVPPRGIGKVSLLKIFEGRADSLPVGVRGQYQNFLILLKTIGEAARNLLPSETVKIVLKESGLEKLLMAGGEDDHDRLENVRELVTLAKRYDDNPGEKGIEAFLTNATLQSDQDALEKPQEGAKLMTVHASKGLEFDYIFITGLEENLFPHMGMGEDEVATEDDEEERRLFYVAITRARKKIYLSYAKTRMLYGARQVNIPSEFVFDVPQDMLVREEGTYGLLRKPMFKIDF
jgi:ATP-dependent DNA helicase UvrD/PcrA